MDKQELLRNIRDEIEAFGEKKKYMFNGSVLSRLIIHTFRNENATIQKP